MKETESGPCLDVRVVITGGRTMERVGRRRGQSVSHPVIPSFRFFSIIPVCPCSLLPFLLAWLVVGCGKGKSSADVTTQKPIPLVQVAKAEKRDLTRKLTFTGSVEPVKVARMASPAEGPIIECLVREGDVVQKGKRLIRIGRSRIAEAACEAAREEQHRQEAEFKRVEQLVKSGSLPREQLEIARANLKRAEAQMAAAEISAQDYEIEAPWDGVVSQVWVAEGNYVSPRTPLITLFDPATLVVRLSIPEHQSLSVQLHQPVEVVLDAHPGRRFRGRVSRVYPELERTTRTMTAEVSLPSDDVRLLSGMFARAEVAVETLSNAVVVPESALVVLPNGETVVFVLEGEKAVRRKVRTALEAGGAVAIADGIQAGETVIVRGQETLKDGAPVQVMGAKTNEGLAPVSAESKQPAPEGQP